MRSFFLFCVANKFGYVKKSYAVSRTRRHIATGRRARHWSYSWPTVTSLYGNKPFLHTRQKWNQSVDILLIAEDILRIWIEGDNFGDLHIDYKKFKIGVVETENVGLTINWATLGRGPISCWRKKKLLVFWFNKNERVFMIIPLTKVLQRGQNKRRNSLSACPSVCLSVRPFFLPSFIPSFLPFARRIVVVPESLSRDRRYSDVFDWDRLQNKLWHNPPPFKPSTSANDK
jgi:hypothetical protein